MVTLYFVRGVSGCGKSTFANEIAGGLNAPVIEADNYFEYYNEGKFDWRLLKSAHEWCRYNVKTILMDGNNCIVANTSTTESEVQEYQNIANECGAKFVSIIVENRHNGKNLHDVPDATIEKQKLRFSIKL